MRGLVARRRWCSGALLLAGTFVTAAGPHAGDADTPRLAAGVPAMAQLHADLLFAYLGLLVALGFALRAVAAPPRCGGATRLLVAVVLAQGTLGSVQYRSACPRCSSSLHVLGAALVVAAAALWAATPGRAAAPTRRLLPRPAGGEPGRRPTRGLVERS